MFKLILLAVLLLVPICLLAEEVEDRELGHSSLPPVTEDTPSELVVRSEEHTSELQSP